MMFVMIFNEDVWVVWRTASLILQSKCGQTRCILYTHKQTYASLSLLVPVCPVATQFLNLLAPIVLSNYCFELSKIL